MGPIQIRIRREPGTEDLPLPRYQTELAAGMDLYAAVSGPVRLRPGERAMIPAGFSIEIPPGYEGQIRPRSGLAIRYGLTMVNAPGTIDADYRGPVQVLLVNLGSEEVTISRGMRIAQLVIAPVARAELVETQELQATARGAGGFGHTGLDG